MAANAIQSHPFASAYAYGQGNILTSTGYLQRSNPPALPVADEEAISRAVLQGDIKQVRAMLAEQTLKHPANSNVLSSAMQCAAQRAHVGIIAYLFSQGATLYDASESFGSYNMSIAMFQVYVDHGLDINAAITYRRVYRNRLGLNTTVLSSHIANETLVRWLLENGADPNASFEQDITPLTFAVLEAPLTTITLLLEHGGNVRKGQLMHYAVVRQVRDRFNVLELLLYLGVDINGIQSNHMDQSSGPEEHRPKAGDTPLHIAIRIGKPDIVSYLVSRGADGTIQTLAGQTARELALRLDRRDLIPLLSSSEQS